jgi:putative oxidoreductase
MSSVRHLVSCEHSTPFPAGIPADGNAYAACPHLREEARIQLRGRRRAKKWRRYQQDGRSRTASNLNRLGGFMSYLFLFARILYGGFFLMEGINHFSKRTIYAQSAASKKVPAPMVAVLGSGSLVMVGGLSILLGLYPEIGLWLIVAFLVGVTPVMHNFWSVSDPNQKVIETVQFTKNVALLGAALMIVVFTNYLGPWPFRMVQ